jgi:hypothetical protein
MIGAHFWMQSELTLVSNAYRPENRKV